MTKDKLKDILRKEAEQLPLQEWASSGWDGYGAAPVTQQHYKDLLQLIEWLPESIDKPEIVAHPTGELALEWFKDRRKVYTILLKDREVIYAALIGDYKNYGREALETDSSISKNILLQYFKS
ncbi:MAG: hypothetical protein Q7K45_05365 [Nanoarchaeota archaeon]|nr:hypothetical protein [Nanoarchaeota archaeon]